MVHVRLIEHKRPTVCNVIGVHAYKNTTVVCILLTGAVRRVLVQLPELLTGHILLILMSISILQVPKYRFYRRSVGTEQGTVHLNSLLLHISNDKNPMVQPNVARKEQGLAAEDRIVRDISLCPILHLIEGIGFSIKR
jgi:hypothetical protein